MKIQTIIIRFAIPVMATIGITSSALAQNVIIGHFGDPAPVQAAIAEEKFAEATGWNIEWRKFAAGTDVISAMASGDVQISDLGSAPIAIASSQGVEIELILNSFIIGTAESLIVRDGAGISNPADLKGKRVAVPIGSTAHFALMGALTHWGINHNEVQIIGMPPDQINAAWTQDTIDAAYVWQPVQAALLKSGTRLAGSDEVATWGYPTFNGWVVNTRFAAENAAELSAFIETMNEANMAFMNNQEAWTLDSTPVQAIAARTGAQPDQVLASLEGFEFLPAEEQASWLIDVAPKALEDTAEFLKSVGRIDSVAEDYSQYVNPKFAKAANTD